MRLTLPGRPTFLKNNGKIFKVQFTKEQEKAIDEAVDKIVYNALRHLNYENNIDTDAAVLWILHRYYGFSAKRCRNVWEKMYEECRNLAEHYSMTDGEGIFISRQLAKDAGIDVQAWYEELGYVE